MNLNNIILLSTICAGSYLFLFDKDNPIVIYLIALGSIAIPLLMILKGVKTKKESKTDGPKTTITDPDELLKKFKKY